MCWCGDGIKDDDRLIQSVIRGCLYSDTIMFTAQANISINASRNSDDPQADDDV